MSVALTGNGGPASGDYGTTTISKSILEKDGSTSTIAEDVPPLGIPKDEKRFWFQRARSYDPDAIATLVHHLTSRHI